MCCLYLPPLRERTHDIAILFQYFMKNLSAKYEKKEFEITAEMLLLKNYNWRGKCPSTENVVELIINTEDFPYKYFSENSEQASPMAHFR